MILVGIDPGPRYTAMSIIENDKIVYSGTFTRPDETTPILWGQSVTKKIRETLNNLYPDGKYTLGIEGVTTPNVYHNGKKSMLNPKYHIHLAFIVGSLANEFPEAVIVRPGKNGSQANYPEELVGRRPKNLPGETAGTRNHERSAYDIAKQSEQLKKEFFKLDKASNIFDD